MTTPRPVPERPRLGTRSPYVRRKDNGVDLIVLATSDTYLMTVPRDTPDALPVVTPLSEVDESPVPVEKDQVWGAVSNGRIVQVRSVTTEDDVTLVWIEHTDPDSPSGFQVLESAVFYNRYVLVSVDPPEVEASTRPATEQRG